MKIKEAGTKLNYGSKKRTASNFSLIQSVFPSKRVVLSQPLINEFDYRSNCNTPCGT